MRSIMWDGHGWRERFIKFKHLPAINHEQQAQGVIITQEQLIARGEARNAAEKGQFRSSTCLVGEPVRGSSNSPEVFPELVKLQIW
jgi:hypothetical protein